MATVAPWACNARAIALPIPPVAPVTTTCLRAVFDASTKDGTHAGVGVQEWEALTPQAAPVKLAGAQGGKACTAR